MKSKHKWKVRAKFSAAKNPQTFLAAKNPLHDFQNKEKGKYLLREKTKHSKTNLRSGKSDIAKARKKEYRNNEIVHMTTFSEKPASVTSLATYWKTTKIDRFVQN